MTPPIKSKGDGRPVAFPRIPWLEESQEAVGGGSCPYCFRPGGGEICDDDHCRDPRGPLGERKR